MECRELPASGTIRCGGSLQPSESNSHRPSDRPATIPAAARRAYFSVNAPQGSLPLLVKGTNGGLSACTNAGPATAPVGIVKVNLVELMSVIGIFGAPAGLQPAQVHRRPAAC